MSRLEEVYEEGSRRWAVVRAGLLLVGSAVAVVGFVTATASLVAGFGLGTAGALRVATLLGGALLLGGFVALFRRGPTTARARLFASVGATFAVVGLALFWTTVSADWTGHVTGLPPLAVGTFAVGLLAVLTAGFLAEFDADDRRADAPDSGSDATDTTTATDATITGSADATDVPDRDSLGGVETMLTGSSDGSEARASSAVGDGGTDDEDLQFFDDEDE